MTILFKSRLSLHYTVHKANMLGWHRTVIYSQRQPYTFLHFLHYAIEILTTLKNSSRSTSSSFSNMFLFLGPKLGGLSCMRIGF